MTTLERTLVDVLDRPHLCGPWEEIWLSLESIEYLDLDQILKYAFLLGNATTIAKLRFFLETHREMLMIPENYLEDLCKHRPMKPHYLERKHKQPQKNNLKMESHCSFELDQSRMGRASKQELVREALETSSINCSQNAL